jgi:hypothetical protein
MPSRKQRRRREKLKRHEYEYVIETEDGEEVHVERLRDLESDGERRDPKAAAPRKGEVLVDRRGRLIQRPSLGRVLRRAAIFAPILFIFVYLTAQDRLSVPGMLFNTLVLVAFFIPFSYLVDTMVYRMMIRRYERDQASKRGR